MGAVVRSTGTQTKGALNESHRWNPHADVAELVDALVSGSFTDYVPPIKPSGPRLRDSSHTNRSTNQQELNPDLARPLMPTQAEIDAQLELERYAVRRAIDRLHSTIRKLEGQTYASATVYGCSSIRDALPRVAKLIDKTGETVRLDEAGKNGGIAGQMVQILDSESLALLSLKVMFDQVCSTKNPCRPGVCLKIGKAVENEAKLRYYEAEAPELFSYVKDKYWHRAAGTRQKASVTSIMMNRRGVEWKAWGQKAISKIGMWLLECIVGATGWFYLAGHGNKKPQTVELTPEYLAIKDDLLTQAEGLASDFIPMLVPPEPWSNDEQGGYLLNQLKEASSMVRRGNSTLRQGEAPLHFLNKLQGVAYRLNRFIVEVAEVLDERGISVGKFLPLFELPLPPKPHDIATNEEARQAYRRAAAEVMNHNAASFRRNARTRATMADIALFKDKDKYYLPWSFDYRGRVYPLPPFLTPQDTDFGKSLVQFAEGSPVTKRAEYWLAFQVATTSGMDKATMDERQAWAHGVPGRELIERIATDPLGNISDWEGAEEPWQFLAACDEFYHCVMVRDRKTTRLPVAVDATCSGLQILAGLSRDRSTAQLVNVLPGDHPRDAYKVVAEAAKPKLPEHLAALLDRKVTKRTVMTIPYNATPHSNRQYIRDALKEKGADFTPEDLGLIVKAVREAMEEVVPGPMRVMRWIKEEVGKAIKRGDTQLSWQTPSSFVVWQKHNKLKTRRIELQLMGRCTMTIVDGEHPQADVTRHKACTAPNLIHSLDASLLHLAFQKFNHPFSVIHDSVLCRATDMDELNCLVRETYQEMFSSNDILMSFAQSIGAETPPPIVGDLDLSQVLNSTYFFS
jgi:DNA-directed RNA polymerase